jgi:uncharacterized membrane protein YebE (DUF533 family)
LVDHQVESIALAEDKVILYGSGGLVSLFVNTFGHKFIVQSGSSSDGTPSEKGESKWKTYLGYVAAFGAAAYYVYYNVQKKKGEVQRQKAIRAQQKQQSQSE